MSLKLSVQTLKEAENVIKAIEKPFGINFNPFEVVGVKGVLEKGIEHISGRKVDIFGKRRETSFGLRPNASVNNDRNNDGEPISRFPITIGGTPAGIDILNIPDSINVSSHSVSHAVPENWNPAKTFIRNT